MKIGVPKEIKPDENRVALTTAGVFELKREGHEIWIEKNAGVGSGIFDEEYAEAGAQIVESAEEVWAKADLLLKVKEPLEEEYPLARKGQVIFTYFHFASNLQLTEAMLKSGATCITYETVESASGSLPLLTPMSEVAGRMAIQEGARYLQKPLKGRGVLLGGVPGVSPGRVLILGAGVVGIQAAKMASGLGAQVTIVDIDLEKLRHVNDILPPHVITEYSTIYNINRLIRDHDLVVGAVLVHGAKAPKLITRPMLKNMRPGTVIVDVAVDQGGCIETSKPTTHEKPTFIVENILHYCVANMPGAVPHTSTQALTNATMPYILQVANKGWKKACIENLALCKGLNIIEGNVVYEGVANAFDKKYVPVKEFLA